MCSFYLLYAGSTSAVSNIFSLGSAGAIKKSIINHAVSINNIKVSPKNNGLLIETNGAELIHSLLIIKLNGHIEKTFRTTGVRSILWDGANSFGARLSNGCYIAEVNDRYVLEFILSGKGTRK